MSLLAAIADYPKRRRCSTCRASYCEEVNEAWRAGHGSTVIARAIRKKYGIVVPYTTINNHLINPACDKGEKVRGKKAKQPA